MYVFFFFISELIQCEKMSITKFLTKHHSFCKVCKRGYCYFLFNLTVFETSQFIFFRVKECILNVFRNYKKCQNIEKKNNLRSAISFSQTFVLQQRLCRDKIALSQKSIGYCRFIFVQNTQTNTNNVTKKCTEHLIPYQVMFVHFIAFTAATLWSYNHRCLIQSH